MFQFMSRIWLTRAVAFITAITLFVAASGVTSNFELLRIIGAVGLLAFAALTFLNGYWRFAIAFAVVGLMYYPPAGVVFPRHIWVILDIAAAVAVLFVVRKTTDSYYKGAAFEKYVASLFPAQTHVIETRTHDSSKFLGRYVETDVDPDFVFRDKKTGRSFAVECKWRKGWTGNKVIGLGLSWDTWKGGRYIAYGAKNKIPVFVAFGIGGTPERPAETYFLRADRLQYRFLKQDFIKSGKTIYQLGELLM